MDQQKTKYIMNDRGVEVELVHINEKGNFIFAHHTTPGISIMTLYNPPLYTHSGSDTRYCYKDGETNMTDHLYPSKAFTQSKQTNAKFCCPSNLPSSRQ